MLQHAVQPPVARIAVVPTRDSSTTNQHRRLKLKLCCLGLENVCKFHADILVAKRTETKLIIIVINFMLKGNITATNNMRTCYYDSRAVHISVASDVRKLPG